VTALEVTNEIVFTLLVRAMLRAGDGGGVFVVPGAADGMKVNLGVDVERSIVKYPK
jgi:hypothetical protein